MTDMQNQLEADLASRILDLMQKHPLTKEDPAAAVPIFGRLLVGTIVAHAGGRDPKEGLMSLFSAMMAELDHQVNSPLGQLMAAGKIEEAARMLGIEPSRSDAGADESKARALGYEPMDPAED